ncbi:MAG: hypothetical protein ACI9J3_000198 [Parvicellaceae bacterium]|jgi:hypothetical protein
MKISINGNSVRFGLTKNEVEGLCQKGMAREKITFNESNFIYAVKVSDKYDNLHACFLNLGIILFIPKDILGDWHLSDQVGFGHSQTMENGQKVELSLEKDFVCSDEMIVSS